MLIMFRANNYTSFSNDVVLDLRKSTYREHPSHIHKIENEELLKTIAIYGANASGKSNLIRAIYTFGDIIVRNFFDKNNENSDNEEEQLSSALFQLKPFILKDNIDDIIEFEIVFINEYKYQYGYSIKDENIISEWLLINDELVYDRSESEMKYGEKYIHLVNKYPMKREDRLYIGVLDYFTDQDDLTDKIKLFKEFFESKLNVYSELILESSVKGITAGVRLSNKIRNDMKFRCKVRDAIKRIDVGISDLIIEDQLVETTSDGTEITRPTLKMIHNVYNNDGKIIDVKKFNLRDESSGTLRFLSFIQEILVVLENGGVYIVDELSSRLHPMLTKFIVDIFQLESNEKAQLIFTSHDTSLMNKEQFRRDEVAIIDKKITGESALYTLSDLDIRKDASFSKDYFSGKYGGIPIISSFNIFECEDHNG